MSAINDSMPPATGDCGALSLFAADGSAAATLLDRRARRLAAARAASAGKPVGIAVLCFRIADETYAIALADLVEVLPLPTWTPVPGVPRELLGVTNVRGEIRPVLNLHVMLGLPEPDLTARAWGVFLKDGGDGLRREVGVRAESLENIRHVDPALLTGQADGLPRHLVAGITPETLILLDARRILAAGVLQDRRPLKEPRR